MPTLASTLNELTNLTNEMFREAWTDQIIDAAFEPDRSWFTANLRRSSENVKGLTVNIPFITRIPGGWRGMDAQTGYTPSGAPMSSDSQDFTLKASASAVAMDLQMLTANKLDWNAIGDMVHRQLEGLQKTFKYYVRGCLWSSYDPTATVNGALAKIKETPETGDGVEVVLDNDGLWLSGHDDDICTLLEQGMWVQALHPTTGVAHGTPMEIIDVLKNSKKINVNGCHADVADNDVLVFSDIAGLETGGADEFPGVLDVIENDNTFQGIDRSAAGNSWAQAKVVDGVNGGYAYDMFQDFFAKCYNPMQAFTNAYVVDQAWQDIADQVRFAQGGTFEQSWQTMKIGNTKLIGDWDTPRDRCIVPDLDNMEIAQAGGVKNLFDKGWQQIAGRPVVEYVAVWFGRLVAFDCRKMGVLENIGTTS